ncbi:MAG: hypothetical protein A3A96_04395 [Candidatus Zambryskibacteria bacterium RIFCSPLOWO2_01_FULL_39_39]|uniref:TVP38/TMEM64 family membrane protein n=1 Tax=Candidatus Zambryskibacteria bacterium RIFCSPLOWO2_01_FULL_39_39 TaxID=1802758 RepID=A0A1G2TWS9_9BACT|nr:MAG: hypothetical protein UT00_C0003G0054 [Parcubacteria group bacterium GW2011_GWA1_38_7]OHA87371.1 MAG: hypothetical protein A2644_04075 [Candidatus Zambryskibacteria bacterium RIFCSPHIGHO2_01_FULL_39_63]OHA95336.1 MAG: hypothetical protein A3B88_02560 [Candidatus Zambryskibacteria bacterium RIFCSPHIGHO2_02_FULL_39_19]OHA97986.1 MAG: hypothetical protein A3F20_04400 [Candidatus Zambryskibacteria bacterium RIFCSPHIGHO2_12_FULL_39_21]OHB01766.1 MAG: hypothetical protein A3A96_04395 [Candidat
MIKIRREKIIEIVWLIVVVALFVISIKMVKSGELEIYVASFGIWAPLIIFFLKASTLIIAPLGGTPLYVLSGTLFGGAKGFLICFLGDIFGSSVCFFLSRKYGQKVLGFFAGSQNVARVLSTVNIISSTKSFIKARLGFISMPELLSYAAGLSKINFWTFSVINALFYIPIDLMLVFLGSKLAMLSGKYLLIYPLILFLIAFVGFLSLYKDYEKADSF